MDFDSFVLAASTADLADEPAARDHADAVEFRMDLAEEPLAQLRSYQGTLPIIATNRRQGEGGEAPEEPERYADLETAIETPMVGAVDVELSVADQSRAAMLREYAADHDVAVVVSTHDFEATPDRGELRSLLQRAGSYGDVGKLAVTATSRGDVLDLLSVTHELTAEGDTVATMAMGEAGRHSRAVAPLYGSRIGYAPVDPADATAPGQYDLATLRELVGDLEGTAEEPAPDP